jgi:hypothetical protein
MLQVKKRKIKLKQYNFIVSDEMKKKKTNLLKNMDLLPLVLGQSIYVNFIVVWTKCNHCKRTKNKKVKRETYHDYLISPGFS